MKAWVKGGLIVLVIGLLCLIFVYEISNSSYANDNWAESIMLILFLIFGTTFKISILIASPISNLCTWCYYTTAILIGSILLFIQGAVLGWIIGWIVGLIKARKQ